MYKIVGVQRSSGEYNGMKYDNYKVHMLTNNDNVIGQQCLIEKVSISDMTSILNNLAAHKKKDMCSVDELINMNVSTIMYNKFGKVVNFMW